MGMKDANPGIGYTEEQAREKSRRLPFTATQLKEIVREHPTPVYIYDEAGILGSAQRLTHAFSWVEGGGFQNYFAVKALPNPHILSLLQDEGMGADCSSLPELLLAEKVGITGENIMFTSNNTPAEEFIEARRLGGIINLDDISHIPYLEKHAGIPPIISFRYNPGSLREGNALIGNPEEAKYGLTKQQLMDAYTITRGKGIRRFGLHTMVASNELDPQYFVDTAQMLFELVGELKEKQDIDIEFVNLGGGIGIPYSPEQQEVNINKVSQGIQEAYQQQIVTKGLDPLRIVMECGRYVTGPHGYLVATVKHFKDTYRQYAGLDASMANLMRPGMYGVYHHITAVDKVDEPYDHVYDVTDSLCENNGKFAVQRPLARLEEGDIVVIHDAGAHGHAMGFNYNGKLRSAELLLKKDGDVQLIRRAETLDDYFATLVFSKDNKEVVQHG